MYPIKEVTKLDMVFGGGGRVMEMMPSYKELGEKMNGVDPKWRELVSAMFFRGLKKLELKPKEGVDKDKALAHIRTILGSFDPKHEHKEAGCAWLFSEWFEDVTFEPAELKA